MTNLDGRSIRLPGLHTESWKLDWKFPMQTMEGGMTTMTTIYVVKTGEQFLCTGEDGDIGMAPVIEDAMSFLSYEEAKKAANENADPGYEIVTVDITVR